MSLEILPEPNFIQTSEILTSLQPDRSPSCSTEYFVHPDFPGLYVKASRLGRSDPDADIDTLRSDFRTYYDLAVEGLRVVPFSLLEYGDQLAVMAHRVDGTPLDEEMLVKPEVARAYDQVLARQIAQFARVRGEDTLYPLDAYHPSQCMWGRLWGTDDPPEIIFVDVDVEESLIGNLAVLADDTEYYYELETIARSLARIKSEQGRELPRAREEILRQLGGLTYTVEGAARSQVIQAALRSNDAVALLSLPER